MTVRPCVILIEYVVLGRRFNPYALRHLLSSAAFCIKISCLSGHVKDFFIQFKRSSGLFKSFFQKENLPFLTSYVMINQSGRWENKNGKKTDIKYTTVYFAFISRLSFGSLFFVHR